MSEHTANAERGEVTIVLDGHAYPMRPSYEAMSAIETRLGSLVALSYRHANPMQGLTINQMATIVTEAVKAAGKERDDAMLSGFAHDKVARLIAEAGPFSVMSAVEQLLLNMITGGAKKKESPPVPITESPTDS